MNKSNLPANPLAGLIKQASELPAETGATEQYKSRLAKATDAIVVLADVSGSMSEPVGHKRKIDILREALHYALNGGEELIAFASTPTGATPATLPEPAGSTALHLALVEANRHSPRKTLVISDGRPDDESRALDAAAALSGTIDVIYCGPDDDQQAIAFMRRLARIGGGQVHVHDIRRDGADADPLRLTVRRALLPPGADS